MKKGTKTYRPNVAAIILSPKYPLVCELFIASRTDIKNAWQFPQGGIDKSETPREALFRELKEEIGTDRIDVVAEYPKWISYDFPNQVVKKMYPYDGQIQKYFLVRLQEQSEINIHTEEPEFDAYKFVQVEDLFNYITYFKRPVYRQVLEYFKRKGYL